MDDAQLGVELSVVMPCLNEADTVATCVRKAVTALRAHNISSEVLVADNGSTDGSQALAREAGATVVQVEHKGYGNALMGGIAAASGKYILMGDADDSYDFLEAPGFVESLRQGVDLVQGCRFPIGGGTIKAGAMPWSHRWLGNPGFSFVARWWFNAPVHDIYCGMRAFTRAHYDRLQQRCTGMEFAVEMILKSSLMGARISEVPITLHPDGRKAHAPHLRTFRDGWRTLRFFLALSPRWVFLIPGLVAVGLGLLGFGLALPAVKVGSWVADAHTLVFSSMTVSFGVQAILFAILSTTFAVNERLLPPTAAYERFYRHFNLEKGIAISGVTILAGLALLGYAVFHWVYTGLGALDYPSTMRVVVPGATLTVVGFQTLLAGLFASILGLQRSRE